MSLGRHPWVLAFAFVVSCGSGSADAPGLDVPVSSGSDALEATDPDSAGVPEPWILPPCYRACDRVTSCGVVACKGFDWSTAGGLFESCFAMCDDTVADAILAAPGCDEVLADAAKKIADYDSRCASDPCDPGCAKLARCVVDECPAIEPPAGEGLVTSCKSTCRPADMAWVVQTGCKSLVDLISGSDPAFKAWCQGATGTCAGPDLCEPYAQKVTGCILAHCDGHADPYKAGLFAVLRQYCLADAKCPDPTSVSAALSPALTCDSPGFKTVGKDPPFTNLCAGTLGVDAAQVRLACEHLLACPGSEGLPGVDGCMAFLAILDDTAARVTCLGGAILCPSVWKCLE